MKVRIDYTEEFNDKELLAIGIRLGHMRPARRVDVLEELNTVVIDALDQYRESIEADVKRLLGLTDD